MNDGSVQSSYRANKIRVLYIVSVSSLIKLATFIYGFLARLAAMAVTKLGANFFWIKLEMI